MLYQYQMPVTRVSAPMNYDEISDRVYAGEVLLFSAGGKILIDAARAVCREALGAGDPGRAHERHSRREFLLRAAEAQKTLNQPACKRQFLEWLYAIGCDIGEELYGDSLGLRIAAPVASHGGGFRSHVGVHRDTWGAGIQAQINWWAPITPLSYRRTLAFYPDYWERPIKNTTAEWSFEEYLASRRKSEKQGKKAAYPAAPQSVVQPVTPPYLVRPRPGEILAFSAAHLHSSVTNHTGRTRFSLEIRTVRARDIRGGRGAPNVDCRSHPPLYRLFRSLSDDRRRLSDAFPESAAAG